MKRVIPVFMLMLGMMAAKAQNDLTRVMVISDPHVLTATNAEKLSFNKGGKLDKMSPSIFAKAVETIVQAKPEALLVCGDMTFNGEASGHELVVAAFAEIEEKGIPVLVIPGNHDISNPFSEDANHENVSPDQFKKLYGAFGFGEDKHLENVSHDAKSLSWAGSLKGTNLGIIGLDANIYDTTANFYSDGCLRKSTIDWMTVQAAALRDKGKMVVCMVHEQLTEHVPGQSSKIPTTLLNTKHTKHPVDGDDEEALSFTDLQKAFADAQIQYVLTGHFHIHDTQNKSVKNSAGKYFTLTELTTCGLSTYPNWMRTLVFDTKNNLLENSKSTMIQTKIGENDLQTVAKNELSTWASDNYGLTVATVITYMNSMTDKYEIYDGTTQFQQEESAYPEVSYTRNFGNHNWQALYIPFDMQFNDWNETCELAKLYTVKSDSLFFTLLKEGDVLEKNTPALIRLKDELPTGQHSITSSVKTSEKSSVMPVDGQGISLTGISLQGTYDGLNGDFLRKNNGFTLSDGELVSGLSNTDSVLLPQRWFLSENSGNNNRRLTLTVQNDTESPLVSAENVERKIGKFIKNGQVIIVKGNRLFNAKGQEVKCK